MRRRRATRARWYLFQRLRGRLLRLSTHCSQDDGGRILGDRPALAHAAWGQSECQSPGQTGLEQGRQCQASIVIFFRSGTMRFTGSSLMFVPVDTQCRGCGKFMGRIEIFREISRVFFVIFLPASLPQRLAKASLSPNKRLRLCQVHE